MLVWLTPRVVPGRVALPPLAVYDGDKRRWAVGLWLGRRLGSLPFVTILGWTLAWRRWRQNITADNDCLGRLVVPAMLRRRKRSVVARD